MLPALRSDAKDVDLREEKAAMLYVLFGLLPLALAAVGLYGLIAYATAHRAGEIGIRIALGAQRRHVRRLGLGDTVKLLIFGAVLGILIALGGAQSDLEPVLRGEAG